MIRQVSKGIFKAENKYKAKKKVWQGTWHGENATIKFDSMAEMQRFSELRLLEMAGKIDCLELQKTFELLPKQSNERAVKCRVDFFYIENSKMIVEEFKSPVTAKLDDYIIKRKLFKWKYPEIEHREVIR